MPSRYRKRLEHRTLHGIRADSASTGRVDLEAYALTAWLHAGLTEAGVPVIHNEARQAKAAMGAKPNKTPRNDAGRSLAQRWYPEVHEPPRFPERAPAIVFILTATYLSCHVCPVGQKFARITSSWVVQ